MVLLTTSASPTDEDKSLAGHLLRWAKVTISDGDTTVILTGGPNKDYFPPYVYYTNDMQGQVGKCYRIVATYKEMTVEAESEILPPTPIDSVHIEPSEGADSLVSLTLFFTSPAVVPAYYHISTRIIGVDSCFYPSDLGSLMVTRPGASCEVPVYRGRSRKKNANYSPQMPRGRTVLVRLERVPYASYLFWQGFNNAVLFGSSPLTGTPGSLTSNVKGGYGLWTGRGSSVVEVVIP